MSSELTTLFTLKSFAQDSLQVSNAYCDVVLHNNLCLFLVLHVGTGGKKGCSCAVGKEMGTIRDRDLDSDQDLMILNTLLFLIETLPIVSHGMNYEYSIYEIFVLAIFLLLLLDEV
jgi:hypothetical protein